MEEDLEVEEGRVKVLCSAVERMSVVDPLLEDVVWRRVELTVVRLDVNGHSLVDQPAASH